MKKFIALLFCCFLIFGTVGCNKEYSANESYAISCAKSMKSKCEVPTSFELNSDVLVFTIESEQSEINVCWFEYSAQNAYGVSVADEAIFYDGDYLGSQDDVRDYINRQTQKIGSSQSIEDNRASSEKNLILANMLVQISQIKVQIKLITLISEDAGAIPENAELISKNLVLKGIK